MHLIIEKISNLKARLPRNIRLSVLAVLVLLTCVFPFVGGGLSNNAILVFVIAFIVLALFLSLNPRRAVCASLVFAFFCISMYLRTGPMHDLIFLDGGVVFHGNDPWYHMRLIENLVQHFPHRISFDAYTIFPTGMEVQFSPFFDWLAGFVIWVAGAGHPSVETIETIGAYYPAVLGALVTVPVYFIGRTLFNRTAGLLAAGLIAIMPGEFFFRSVLGFTDHHVAEVLFSTTLVMFLLLALKSAREKGISFHSFNPAKCRNMIKARTWRSSIKCPDWQSLRKPLLFAILAGVMLSVYLLSWVGGILFIFIVFVYLIIQYVVHHFRGESTDYLCIIGFPLFLVALILVVPNLDLLIYGNPVLGGLVIGTLALPVLSAVSQSFVHFKLRRLYYPLAIGVLGGFGVLFLYLISPDMYHDMMSKFTAVFSPGVTAMTVQEARPLFSGFEFTNFFTQANKIWWYFATSIFVVPLSLFLLIFNVAWKRVGGRLLLAALGLLILLTTLIYVFADMPGWFNAALYLIYGLLFFVYAYFERSAGRVLLVIWCYVMLLAMVGQTRFAYYFAVNAALLTGYFCLQIPTWISQTATWAFCRKASPEEMKEAVKSKKKAKGKRALAAEQERPNDTFEKKRRLIIPASNALAAVVVFFLAFYPLIGHAMDLSRTPFGPNEGWRSALVWLSENTPEPFGDPNAYYDIYEKPPEGESYKYPDTAYGVMSWWDYGHWILRIGRRIPNANPHQMGIGGRTPNGSIVPGASTFMTAQNESEGSWILDELGSRYVVIDIETDISKFHVMATWSEQKAGDFLDRFYWSSGNESGSYMFYYPRYYQSMCSRLYNFDGEAVVPNNSTWAIAYTEMDIGGGKKVKWLNDVANGGEPFATYSDAKAFTDANPSYTIVGIHPFMSPVPLEKLEHYRTIHHSSVQTNVAGAVTPYVKIFEYTP